MDTDELTIGRFGRLCGLSVHTLRHYDDVGLLTPARVDEATGYRYYLPDQLERARHIRSLRWTDLSVEDTRTVLDDPTRAGRARRPPRPARARARTHRGEPRRHRAVRRRGAPRASPPTGARPVQIKLLVADLDAAAAFYIDAFGFDYEVTQRTADEDFSGFVFGRYGESDFFLVHLQTADYPGAAGPATIGCSWTTSTPRTAERSPPARPRSSARTTRRACRARRPCGTPTPTWCGSTRADASVPDPAPLRVEAVAAAGALAAVGSVVLREAGRRRHEPAAHAHAVAEEVLPAVVPGESEPALACVTACDQSGRRRDADRLEGPRDDNGPGAAPRLSSRAAPGPHVRQHLLAFAHRARLSLLRAA